MHGILVEIKEEIRVDEMSIAWDLKTFTMLWVSEGSTYAELTQSLSPLSGDLAAASA